MREMKDSGIDWIGEIPAHWEVKRFKAFAKTIKGKSYDTLNEPFDGSYKVLSVECLRQDEAQFYDYVFVNDENQICTSNDIVVIWDGAGVGEFLKAKDGVLSSTIAKIQLTNKSVIIPYLWYWRYKVEYRLKSIPTGMGIPHLNPTLLNNFKIAIPPIEEQQAIANYLDEKTAEIDKQISLLERQQKAYEKLKQSLINRAVTRGLNPNVPLKNSGIDWIGEIPANWQVKRLKDVAFLKARIGWKGLRSEEFETNSYAYLVTGQDFKQGIIDWKNCYQINKVRYDEDPYIQINNGDLLITKDGTIGKIARVESLDKPACLNSGVFVLKQTQNKYFPNYLYWSLCSNIFKGFYSFSFSGSTILHLYQNVFEKMPIVIPQIEEQRAIADYLDEKTAEIDRNILLIGKKIEAYKRLKKSLIDEVVTGKRKV